ncbi:MAG: (d)CMP kinase [Victivallaceae bacterium]|nr:(d)CMP kinase [Victivallaceae bacterium]
MKKSTVIAMDGPAASGKSTVARLLAKKLSIPCVNTGSMYRALGGLALEKGLNLDEEANLLAEFSKVEICYGRRGLEGDYELMLNAVAADEQKLRSVEIAGAASRIARLRGIRAFLVQAQRACASAGWVVMEGRDIGTVIFPDAAYKFFVTASPMVRARRRMAENGGGTQEELERTAAAIAERDRQDAERPVAPLKQAKDAILVDTSDLTIEEVVNLLYYQVKEAVC